MAEDQLDVIYQDFVAAATARDEAMETLNDAISALKAANSKYNAAVSELADYLGASDVTEGTDNGDIFKTLTGGATGLTDFTGSKLFGDLF